MSKKNPPNFQHSFSFLAKKNFKNVMWLGIQGANSVEIWIRPNYHESSFPPHQLECKFSGEQPVRDGSGKTEERMCSFFAFYQSDLPLFTLGTGCHLTIHIPAWQGAIDHSLFMVGLIYIYSPGMMATSRKWPQLSLDPVSTLFYSWGARNWLRLFDLIYQIWRGGGC